MRYGLRLGRLFGVDVQIDWSMLIIFFLIATSLASGIFPSWHPEWSAFKIFLTAFTAAVLFFFSVFLHEMSHALVGRYFGAQVPRITLFVFGGIAEMEKEPKHWYGEFWMAIVGPITSIAIGLICLFIVNSITDIDPQQMANPEQVLRELSPLATLLMWLGPINIILAIFNLVPGFPLDGGRVLRAAIWGATGDRHKATRIASNMGQGFAWFLIAVGFAMILGIEVPIFGTGFIGGLWLALIGWLLNNAAITSYQQSLQQKSLRGIPVKRIMQTDFATLPPDISLDLLINDYLVHSNQRVFAVAQYSQFLGLVCLEDLRKVPYDNRPSTTVADIMTPKDQLITSSPYEDAADAAEKLNQRGVGQLPVLEQGQLLGLLTRESVMRWLSLQNDSLQSRKV